MHNMKGEATSNGGDNGAGKSVVADTQENSEAIDGANQEDGKVEKYEDGLMQIALYCC